METVGPAGGPRQLSIGNEGARRKAIFTLLAYIKRKKTKLGTSPNTKKKQKLSKKNTGGRQAEIGGPGSTTGSAHRASNQGRGDVGAVTLTITLNLQGACATRARTSPANETTEGAVNLVVPRV